MGIETRICAQVNMFVINANINGLMNTSWKKRNSFCLILYGFRRRKLRFINIFIARGAQNVTQRFIEYQDVILWVVVIVKTNFVGDVCRIMEKKWISIIYKNAKK